MVTFACFVRKANVGDCVPDPRALYSMSLWPTRLRRLGSLHPLVSHMTHSIQ